MISLNCSFFPYVLFQVFTVYCLEAKRMFMAAESCFNEWGLWYKEVKHWSQAKQHEIQYFNEWKLWFRKIDVKGFTGYGSQAYGMISFSQSSANDTSIFDTFIWSFRHYEYIDLTQIISFNYLKLQVINRINQPRCHTENKVQQYHYCKSR